MLFSQSAPLDLPCINVLPGFHPSNPLFHANLCNIHAAYINTYFPSIWEINPSSNLDSCGRSLPHGIPKGLNCSLQGWGGGVEGGGVHLHTSLMVRLLQITHDTSSDDIFQPPPCWMSSPAPLYHPSIHHHHHQHPTPTHTLIPPSIHVTIAQQRLLPPAFTWLTLWAGAGSDPITVNLL